MSKPTQEEMKNAIENCVWRFDVGGGDYVCKGALLPCMAVLKKGECVTLIELAKKKRGNE